ncbi:MAG: membrane protein insertase YidC [Mycoplasmoidaceae bacterium]
MGNSSALKYSSIMGNDTTASAGSPFWADKNTNRKTLFKTIMKQVWKWTKIAIFLFMMLMGLWGCFQSMGDGTINQNPALGNGLEFGFPFATTGDYRFDLQMAITASQYNTLSFDWWISGVGCHSPFYALFVWPAAALVTIFMWATKDWVGGLNALLAIFLLLLFIRILTMAISLKSSFQSEKMTELQGQIADINAKYKDLNDAQSKQMKQQEIMALYSKNNVKPFAAFEQMFLTLPIFLIIYRVVTIVRPIKVTVLFGIWNFAASPLTQVFSNFSNLGWTYLFFLLLVAGSQIFSMKMPQFFARKRNRSASTTSDAGKKQYKKTQRTQNIFMIVMVVIVAFSAVGVGVYWFLNSLFTVLQAWIIHKLIERKKTKDKQSGARIVNFNI